MPKSFHKHKLLLDEHLRARRVYATLNHNFDVKHIRDDLNQGGADDRTVYLLASSLNRIVITANGRDFWPLVSSGQAGVIDIPANWTPTQVDTKLAALLKRHGPAYFAGQYRTLANE